jgi:hypothetical protein
MNYPFEWIFALTLRDNDSPIEKFEDYLTMSYVLRQSGRTNLIILLHKARKPQRVFPIVVDFLCVSNNPRTLLLHPHFTLIKLPV